MGRGTFAVLPQTLLGSFNMTWKKCILWMLVACAMGVWFQNFAPGTSLDDRFWESFLYCEHGLLSIFRHPWVWLPSIFICLSVFIREIRALQLRLDRSKRLKIAGWLFLALLPVPWLLMLLTVFLSNPVEYCAQIIRMISHPVFQNSPNFCQVCDITLMEDLQLYFFSAILIFLYACGIRDAYTHVRKCFKVNATKDPRNLFVRSCFYLLLCSLMTDILVRFACAEECIHQGLH